MQTCYPITKPVRSAAPTFEPVTRERAKLQIDLAAAVTLRDEQVDAMIVAAREKVEHDAMTVCATGAFVWKFTEFPWADYFELPRTMKPVSSITSITYVATDGTNTTWDSSNYSLDTHTIAPTVKRAYNTVWPTLRYDLDGVTVTAVCGYATPLLVPQTIQHAVLMYVKYLWNEGDKAKQLLECYENLVANVRPEVYA